MTNLMRIFLMEGLIWSITVAATLEDAALNYYPDFFKNSQLWLLIQCI